MRTNSWRMLMKMKKPDEIFDLIVWQAYQCGSYDLKIPVEESRKAFEHIKKLLKAKEE